MMRRTSSLNGFHPVAVSTQLRDRSERLLLAGRRLRLKSPRFLYGGGDDEGLPICRECGRAIPNGEGRYRGPDGEVHVRCFDGPRILVVDDDAELRELIVTIVRRGRRCQVHAVSDGQEALQRIRSETYDLILCDLRMPEMDGPAFYEAIRSERPELAARIVFMTAHLRADYYSAFLRTVEAPVLSKPFTREDLNETLARMIGPRVQAS